MNIKVESFKFDVWKAKAFDQKWQWVFFLQQWLFSLKIISRIDWKRQGSNIYIHQLTRCLKAKENCSESARSPGERFHSPGERRKTTRASYSPLQRGGKYLHSPGEWNGSPGESVQRGCHNCPCSLAFHPEFAGRTLAHK